MSAVVCGKPVSGSKKWVLRSQDKIVGNIRRSRLDNGFTMTHSSLKTSEDSHSSVIESGEVVNFVYVLKGELNLTFTGASGWHPMSEGAVYAFQTNDVQINRRIAKNIDTEALIIKVCRHRLENIMSDTGCIINVPEPGKTEVLFYLSPFSFMLCRKIIDCRYAGETGRLMQLAGATDLLTDNFKSCYNQSAGREESIVLEVINYIRNNLSEEHSLAKLAHMAGMSHTKLNRLFRIKMGLSVFEFIRQEKVHRAEHYLRTTDMTITEIAYCTGFCSSSHFSESFRREKGLSPKLYRKSV